MKRFTIMLMLASLTNRLIQFPLVFKWTTGNKQKSISQILQRINSSLIKLCKEHPQVFSSTLLPSGNPHTNFQNIGIIRAHLFERCFHPMYRLLNGWECLCFVYSFILPDFVRRDLLALKRSSFQPHFKKNSSASIHLFSDLILLVEPLFNRLPHFLLWRAKSK